MIRMLKNRRAARSSRELAAEAVLHPSPDVLTARCEGAVVLLDLRSEQFLGLDDAAVTIWSGVEAGRPFRAIVETLADEFDADPLQLERDARAFLNELCARRLVVHA